MSAKVTIFLNCIFGGKEEFPASRSAPSLMVLNKDRKYVISLFFQLFLWFISGQTKVHWRLFIIQSFIFSFLPIIIALAVKFLWWVNLVASDFSIVRIASHLRASRFQNCLGRTVLVKNNRPLLRNEYTEPHPLLWTDTKDTHPYCRTGYRARYPLLQTYTNV
jgi:hypothetical protein